MTCRSAHPSNPNQRPTCLEELHWPVEQVCPRPADGQGTLACHRYLQADWQTGLVWCAAGDRHVSGPLLAFAVQLCRV